MSTGIPSFGDIGNDETNKCNAAIGAECFYFNWNVVYMCSMIFYSAIRFEKIIPKKQK